MTRRWLLVATVPMLLFVTTARLDAQTASGVIQGTITDTQGAVLPGVTLTVRSVETGIVRTTASQEEGRYRVAALPPGHYELAAELPGFATLAITDIILTVGQEFRRDLVLQVGALEQSIAVVEQEQLIETTKIQASAVVTQEQITSLPVEGRSAVKLALLVPGTSEDGTRARRPGASVGIGGISLAGTNYIVDNMNNMTLRTGDSREDIPQAAVQEFRVIVSQYPAEFGGRVGGVINVVTKSGGNRFSGEAFEFFRNKSLNRVDKFQQAQHDQLGTPINDFRRHQYGVSLGGPILKDRVHFFTSLERKDSREFFTVNTGRPQFYSSLEGTFQGGSVINLGLGKLDFQITPSQHLSLKYFQQGAMYFSDGAGGTNAAFSATDVDVPGRSYVVGHTWLLSSRIVNEFTGMNAESFQDGPFNEKFTPAAYLKNGSSRYVFPSLTWGVGPATFFHNYYKQFRDALSISTGNHNWKFGGGIQWLTLNMRTPGNVNGTWTFGTDQYFNPADPAFSFTSLRGATQFAASLPVYYPTEVSHTYEAYAQDAWKVLPNLTLDLGVRYDLQKRVWNERVSQSRYPRPLPYVDFASRGDSNNVAPRVGLAWDIRNDGRSVVRAGYGIIYTNAQHNIVSGEGSAFQQYSITIRNPSYPDPYQGRDPLTFVSTAPPNISIGANNLVNAPAQTFNTGFSGELGPSMAIHVDGVYTKVDHLPTSVQINEPDPLTRRIPLPEWGHISQTKPIGTYRYKALLTRFENRGTRHGQFVVSYTLGKQDAKLTVTDWLNPNADLGPADNDRRHSLSASGSTPLPWNINIGVLWTLRSARPFSALAGRDLNADGTNNDLVPGTTRNQGNRDLDLSVVNAWRAQNALGPLPALKDNGDTYNRLDIRASKAITLGERQRIELIGQVFNVLGRDNLGAVGVTTYVTNATSDSFGRILTAQPRQQAELAVRFVW